MEKIENSISIVLLGLTLSFVLHSLSIVELMEVVVVCIIAIAVAEVVRRIFVVIPKKEKENKELNEKIALLEETSREISRVTDELVSLKKELNKNGCKGEEKGTENSLNQDDHS